MSFCVLYSQSFLKWSNEGVQCVPTCALPTIQRVANFEFFTVEAIGWRPMPVSPVERSTARAKEGGLGWSAQLDHPVGHLLPPFLDLQMECACQCCFWTLEIRLVLIFAHVLIYILLYSIIVIFKWWESVWISRAGSWRTTCLCAPLFPREVVKTINNPIDGGKAVLYFTYDHTLKIFRDWPWFCNYNSLRKLLADIAAPN